MNSHCMSEFLSHATSSIMLMADNINEIFFIGELLNIEYYT